MKGPDAFQATALPSTMDYSDEVEGHVDESCEADELAGNKDRDEYRDQTD